VTYEGNVGALKGRYGDHQLVAAYPSQLNACVQLSGKTLQEFAAAIKQLSHRALFVLTVDFI